MRLRVAEAESLPKMDRTADGSVDPYCVVTYGMNIYIYIYIYRERERERERERVVCKYIWCILLYSGTACLIYIIYYTIYCGSAVYYINPSAPSLALPHIVLSISYRSVRYMYVLNGT